MDSNVFVIIYLFYDGKTIVVSWQEGWKLID